MKNCLNKLPVITFSLIFFLWFPLVEAQDSNLFERIEKLERTMSTAGLIDLVEQLESLQKEVRLQRGDIEKLQFQIQKISNGNNGFQEESNSNLPAEAEEALATDQEILVPNEEILLKETPGLQPDKLGASNGDQPSPSLLEGERSYRAAFSLLKEGKYLEAIEGFKLYLMQNPKGKYSDNSQYWLGEAHYVLQDYVEAIVQYSKLIQDFPESKKSSHAMLKVGYCYEKLGEYEKAINTLSELGKRFPDSAAAMLGVSKIEKLKSE